LKRELRLSIVIPTLDEANNLPLLLSDLGEIREKSEILIIDSDSKDATEDISKIYGAKFFNKKVKNRGLQLNTGAKEAKGDWLLFIHADSRLSQKWSEEVNLVLSKENKLIYFFNFKVNNNNLIYRFLEFLVNLRTFLLKTPYGDQGLLISSEKYFQYGGYKNLPIMEDIDLINRIKSKEEIFSLKTSIYTSSRKWQKNNLLYQSIMNFKLRRKWAKGYDLNKLYEEYYKKKK